MTHHFIHPQHSPTYLMTTLPVHHYLQHSQLVYIHLFIYTIPPSLHLSIHPSIYLPTLMTSLSSPSSTNFIRYSPNSSHLSFILSNNNDDDNVDYTQHKYIHDDDDDDNCRISIHHIHHLPTYGYRWWWRIAHPHPSRGTGRLSCHTILFAQSEAPDGIVDDVVG